MLLVANVRQSSVLTSAQLPDILQLGSQALPVGGEAEAYTLSLCHACCEVHSPWIFRPRTTRRNLRGSGGVILATCDGPTGDPLHIHAGWPVG